MSNQNSGIAEISQKFIDQKIVPLEEDGKSVYGMKFEDVKELAIIIRAELLLELITNRPGFEARCKSLKDNIYEFSSRHGIKI